MKRASAVGFALLSSLSISCADPPDGLVEQQRSASTANRFYGTYCGEDFQNGWLPSLSYSGDRCNDFNSSMNSLASNNFYYSLEGTKPYFEDTYDQYEGETVDLLFVNTHGGAWANDRAEHAMYEANTMAYTNAMRFGDEGRGLSLLSTYACHTIQHDAYVWDRWIGAFNGGLRMVTGSHDTVWSGWTTSEVGSDYAQNMGSGDSVKNSWKRGLEDWWEDQDVAVLTTGRYPDDCWWRMDNITWSNLTAVGRNWDGGTNGFNIGYMCWTWWDDL